MAIRCQCTKANEVQLRGIFAEFAAAHPHMDITYDHVNEAMNEIGRQNAAESGWPGSGERQCFTCDKLVHMLVQTFNESHDPSMILPDRKAPRTKDMTGGLCSVAASRDYTDANRNGIPDLSGSPIEAPARKSLKR